VDAKRLASGSVKGKRFSVQPVKVDDKVVDIVMVPAAEGELATMGAGVPEELENDPYNILSELFAIIPDLNKGQYDKIFKIPGLRELIIKLTGFDIKDIAGSLMNSAPKMLDIAFRKYISPLMKGDRKMTANNAMPNGMPMPPMPPMPLMPPMPFMPPMWNDRLSGSLVSSHTPGSVMVAPHSTVHPIVLSSPTISATPGSGMPF
jgi:hypothetical protein